MMIHVEPLGTDVILPAFVVGYEIPLPKGNPDHFPSPPRWIITVNQQAGGMAMCYPDVVGVVLRLEANRERGKKPLDHLIHGLKLMAEDPKVGVLKRDYPVLGRLVRTWGREYAENNLRDLDNLLAASLWMPPLKSGVEAFLRCAKCDPMDCFTGWKMLGCEIRQTGNRRGSIFAMDKDHCYYVDDSSLADLVLTDEDEFGKETCDVLKDIGKTCGQETDPDVFFLWENSD